MNVVSITGWLLPKKPPEIKYFGSGSHRTRFVLKVNRNYQKSGEDKKVSFISCEVWGKPAENLFNRKGNGVGELGITGELVQDRWEKDGQKQSRVYINVSRIDYLRNGDDQQQTTGQPRPPAPQAQPVESYGKPIEDYDEVSF